MSAACVSFRWCLGKVGEGAPKTGVVVFAPGARDSSGLHRDQRHVGVVAETDSGAARVFWFRGSWLKRAAAAGSDSKAPQFRSGARVQLDPAKWACAGKGSGNGKKCLGSPAEAAYGLVVNAGVPQKDGSTRNMEVRQLLQLCCTYYLGLRMCPVLLIVV